MKNLYLTIFELSILFTGIDLYAQQKKKEAVSEISKLKFGVGLEGATPISGLNTYAVGAGLSFRLTKGVAKNFDATLTSGVMGFSPKNFKKNPMNTKPSIFIPIKLGGRLMLTENFYTLVEAGLTFTKTYDLLMISNSVSYYVPIKGTSFVYAPGIGLKFGGFTTDLRYESMNDGKLLNAKFLGLRVGIQF